MKLKRTLTEQRHAVGAYWEYVLGSCEELLLDLGNLAGKRGLAADVVQKDRIPTPGATDDPDPGECRRFREKWSHLFLVWDEARNYQLLELRRRLRRALIHGGPKDLQVLAIEMANVPPRAATLLTTGGQRHVQYLDFYLSRKGLSVIPRPFLFGVDSMQPAELDWKPPRSLGTNWKAPILFDFPRALAAALVSFIGKGRKLVCCPQCGRCTKGRSNQRFCPGAKCRRAWHRSQPGNKKKWRAYMRQKMREYRALEKRRNQINQKLSRGKHAKAKKA